MPIDFYYVPYSSPCRSVLMLAEALNLELNLKLTTIHEGQHMAPEFLKMNPQHTIPTINDNGFSLWESRAILTYLVNKYGKGSSLYPQDPQARAVVDNRLYFDLAILSQRFKDYTYPQIFGGTADETKLKKVEEGLEFLDKFLESGRYVAGDNLTVADFSILATVSHFHIFNVDIFKYPNIKAWYERMKSAPGFDKNLEGAENFAKSFEEYKKKLSS